MDVPQNFRSALNGFRREDVVRYLEYLNARHTAEVNQLSKEADSLRQELAELKEKLEAQESSSHLEKDLEEANARIAQLSEEKDRLSQKLEADPAENSQADSQELSRLKEENTSLKSELDRLKESSSQEKNSLEERCAELKAALEDQKAVEEKNLASQELEAYRRAERAERIAAEKADLIYHRANTILSEATGKMDGTSADLTELADRINGQLQQMQYTINSGKIALKSAVESIQALRTEEK